MVDVALTFVRAEAIHQRSDGIPECFNGACLGRAQQRLELGKHLLDRIEVRAVGRQVLHLRSHALDGLADAHDLVRTQVVHHHDVAVAQLWRQELLDPGAKRPAVDGPVEHQRGEQPVAVQCTDHRRGAPVPAGGQPQAALAPGRAAPRGRHVGGRPGFVQEDQALPGQCRLSCTPLIARLRYIGALLLAGVNRFFLRVTPNRTSVLCIVEGFTAMPWVA